MYVEAIQQYKEVLGKEENIKQALFSIGYCYYKMRDFKKVLEYCQKVLKVGYDRNDLREFLTFVSEQTEDEKIKQLAQSIIEQFDNFICE